MRNTNKVYKVKLTIFTMLTFGAALLSGGAANSTTLNVPSAYPTIQAAINAANTGDTVLVADGTYSGTGNYNIDTLGKAITVQSQGGPTNCIIDVKALGTCFNIHSNETTSTVIEGLTIHEGSGLSIGGSYYSDGGGFYISSASPTISNCDIRYCNVTRYGGAFYLNAASPIIKNCTTVRDSASYDGNGFYLTNASIPTITSCYIYNNNTAVGDGGGLFLGSYSNAVITNCLIGGNSAINGAAMYLSYSNPVITNCTITQNIKPFSQYPADGIYLSNSSPIITNTILYDDTVNDELHYDGTPSTPVVTYSDVNNPSTIPGAGNIDSEPLFVNFNSDWQLSMGSPCLGAGTATNAPTTDIDGKTRPTPPSIGAYEGGPKTSSSLTGTVGTNGWYQSPVTITLSVADPIGTSDIAHTYYSNDYGAQQIYTIPVSIKGDGYQLISYWSVDNSGHVETATDLRFTIDSTPPTTTQKLAGYKIGTVWVGGVTATLNPTDATSGVAATYYEPAGAAYMLYAVPFTTTESGTHAWTYWSVDNAGNVQKPVKVTATVVQPDITALSRTSVKAGDHSLTITVTGNYFISGAKVTWNGTAISTTYVSANQLTAIVPGHDLTTVGTANIQVVNPKTYGKTNNETFTVN